ncbi:unnamed protein product, partial [Didymodactylos carnosus]
MFENFCLDFHLNIGKVNQPTSKRSNQVIDVVCASANVDDVSVILYGTSDHFPVRFVGPWITDSTYVFKDIHWNVYSLVLSFLQPYFMHLCYRLPADAFLSLLSNFLGSFVVKVTRYVQVSHYRRSLPVWIREEISILHHLRNRYYRHHSQETYIGYTTQRQFVDFFVKEHRAVQWDNFLKQCKVNDNNHFWKFTARHYQSSTPRIKGITTESGVITDPACIVGELHQYYQEHFRLPIEKLSPAAQQQIDMDYEYFCTLHENSPEEKPLATTFEEVSSILKFEVCTMSRARFG